MNMAKNKLFDLALLGAAVLLLAGAGWVWHHFSKSASQIALAVRSQESELKEASAKIKLLQELRAKSGALERQKQWLATFIPNEEGQAQFIGELQRLAERSGIEIISCTLESAPKSLKAFPNYAIYQWKVSFDGTYPGMLAFFDELPASERCVNVAELKLASSGGADDKGKNAILHLDCTLDLVTTAPGEKVKP